MSLGLQLRSETTPPGVPLTLTHQLLAEWFRRECDHVLRGVNLRDEDGVETLFVELHPAAEDLRLWFENGTEVVVSAQTSSAGPGYHVYVCDLLLSMAGEFGFRWKADSEEDFDETGYFESRDAGALCKEMLAWLSAVCTSVLDESHDECAGLPIAMPWGVSYKVDQFLITAMGPRSRTWTESVARDPNAGSDFFAWWTPGFTAEYYLRRAICLMWNSVRWRPPLTDDERRVLSEVRENLEAAHKLDDSLDCPWREWSELIGFLHTEADVPSLKEVRDSSAPLIGYRRNPVRVALSGGWSVEIPGEFAETWEEDTWCAFNSDTTVRVTAFRSETNGIKKTARDILLEFKPENEDVLTHETADVLGKGTVREVEEDGQRYCMLQARTAAEGRFCLCTICYPDCNSEPVALRIWKSLTL